MKAGLIRPIKIHPFPEAAFDKLDYSRIKGIVSAEMSIPALYGVDVENAVRRRAPVVNALSSGGEILERDTIIEAAYGLLNKTKEA